MEQMVMGFVNENLGAEETEKVFRGPDGEMISALELRAVLSQSWSNGACIGYAIRALEFMGMESAMIQQFVLELRDCFDIFTLGEAQAHYENSPY
ncbi:hypothetical protein [Pseudoflavonifractor phocaeensis]|uniref:hypothetical protein n=1 Tax=Pseudoflavonifractor phocaeensis TaxID=1870988 RepID=UPI00210EED63|nr:hypothetical protein [Pseudoflavonifractor phocaeensis]MCQ4864948.1 hypothetical protein [Pseudoflavonifractor phocaeensis]